MEEYRKYTRGYTPKQINQLQTKYDFHLQRRRRGFLSSNQKKILLHLSKWKKGTDNSAKHKFFYELRESAKTAFGDYLLLTETLNDDQLKEIFTHYSFTDKEEKYRSEKNIEHVEFYKQIPVLHNVLESLFKLEYQNEPVVDSKGKFSHTISLPKDIDDEWQARFAEETIRICLKFFKEHSLISTKAHERLVEEVEDMINVEVARGTKLKLSERVKGWI